MFESLFICQNKGVEGGEHEDQNENEGKEGEGEAFPLNYRMLRRLNVENFLVKILCQPLLFGLPAAVTVHSLSTLKAVTTA